MMIKQTGRLVGACRFVLAGDGLTLTYEREEGQAFYKEWLEKHPEYAEK